MFNCVGPLVFIATCSQNLKLVHKSADLSLLYHVLEIACFSAFMILILLAVSPVAEESCF